MPTYSVSIPGRGTFDVESPTPLTDYQAYLAVQRQLEAEPPPPAPPVIAPPPEGGFFPAVKRGFLQAGMLTGDILPAMAARAVGADEYAERQLKEAAETQARIQREVPAAVPSFTDISSLGDAWTYAKEAVGESLASIIPTLLTGGAAGLVARPAIAAANTAAREAAEAALLAAAMRSGPPTQAAIEAAKKQAIDAGIKAAQRTAFKYEFAGGFAGSAAQNIPEVYQNILEETGKESIPAALAFGGFNAALDTVLPAKLLAKMRGQGLSPTETMAAWYARGAKGLGKGFLIEGATEAAQETSSIAAENFIAENSDFFNQKNLERVINAGLKGGLGGGVITGATDIALGQAPLPEVTDRQRAEQLQREILGEIDVARGQQLKEEEEAAALAKAEAERPPTVNEIVSMASSPTGYEDLEAEKQRLLKQPRTEETREAIKIINEIQQRIIVEEQQRRAPSVRVPSIDDLVSLAQMPDGYAQLEVEKQNLLKQRKTPEIKEALDAIKDFQTRMVTEQAERQRPPLQPIFDDKTIRSLGFVKSENPNSVYQQLIGKSVADPDAVSFLQRYATTAREQTKDRIDRFLKQVERYQIPLTAEEAAKGAADVREAIPAAGREGLPVVGEPPAIPAARGPGAVEPTGVVPVETDVGQPPRREAAAPAPIETPATERDAVQQHAVKGLPIVEAPLDQVTLSKDVPQFKSEADELGIVKALEGKFERTGVAPIQLWRRTDGRLEVISGRHRFDLAKRSGETTIPAQIHDEAAGFDAKKAATLDAELNIRDEQGEVKDYVVYFEKSGISEDEAKSRGLLGRPVGQRGWAIASKGSPDLIAAHRSGIVPDDAAAGIATAAPGDSRLQAAGIRAAQQGKNTATVVNTVQAVKALAKERGVSQDQAGDLFGFDDSAIREAEEMARVATQKQQEIGSRLAAITGAAKKPEVASKEGIDIRDPEALNKRVQELRQKRAAWNNWSSSPDLIKEIQAAIKGEPPAKPSLPAAAPAPKPLKLSKETEAKIEELGKILERILGKFGLRNVALNIERDLKNNGEYANRLIKLALDADSPVRDLRHESLHAMKELGFFSDAQWKTLEKMARDKWVDKYLKNAPSTYNGETMSRYDAYMRLYNGNEETILEEAIADAFSDFDITKPPPGLMQALLRRMRDLFRGIKEAMGIANIDSAEDIFRRVEKGELKETAAAPPAATPKPSLRAPKADLDRSLNDKRISPRLPTAVKATEDPMSKTRLQPDLATFKRDNTAFRHNIALMSKYPNFAHIKGTPDQRAEQMINHMKENLLWLYKNWREDLRDRSKLWYVGGNKISHRWAQRYGIEPETAAGIIAALSPQKDWFQNVSLAERTLDALVFNADTQWNDAMTRVFRERSWAKKFPLGKFQGTTLKDMYVPGDPKSLVDMAAWIRAWDEATNPQTARVITPEGTFSNEIASGKTDKPIAMRAQSFAAMVKTLQVLQQTDLRVISDLIGKNHKVRSFYNNIIAPYAGDDVTIDTHAVAAALLRPLGSSDLEVYHNFGSAKPAKKDKEGNILVPASQGTKNSAITGLYGTYAMYAEAYRRAAEDAKILPREMQSITWEAIRGLFRPEQKQAKLKQQTNVLWNKVGKGEVDGNDARQQISRLVSGIQDPAWARSPAGTNESTTDSSYADKLPGVGVPGREPERLPGRVGERVAGAVPKASLRAPQTEAFTNWFGNSKVVDNNGDPLVVYHGTGADIAVFDPSKQDPRDAGFWFANAPVYANQYAAGRKGGNVMPVYLSLKNPKIYYDRTTPITPKLIENLKAQGHDGIIRDFTAGPEAWRYAEGQREYAVFQPEQIKSATGNIGTYDITIPDIRRSLRAPQTETFKKWSGGAPVISLRQDHVFVSGKPVVVEALHGTTNADITEFKKSKANIESDFGAGFYASNTPADVAINYANVEGADLTRRIETLAERIADNEEFGGDMDAAMEEARKRLSQGAPNTMKLYMLFKNPAVLGGKGETFFDYNQSYNEETEEYGEPTGSLVNFVNQLDEIGEGLDISMRDVERAKQDLIEAGRDNEGLKLSEVAQIVKDRFSDTYDLEGGSAANGEVLRQTLEGMGFDGVIDTSAYAKFGPRMIRGAYSMVKTEGMAGLDKDTVHFVAFKPTQIKSATGNIGTFDITKPDIRYSLRDSLGLYSELENKVAQGPNKAPAASWKAYINGLTQKGVKPEEIEWSGVRDWLDLQTGPVSKDAVNAYLKQGGVKVEETVLGQGSPDIETFLTINDLRVEPEGETHWFVESPTGSRLIAKSTAPTEDAAKAFAVRYFNGHIEERNRERRAKAQESKFGQYTLPGGENYREVLLTLPGGESIEQATARRDATWEKIKAKMPDGLHPMRQTVWAEENVPDLYQEWQDASRVANKRAAESDTAYRSSHWDQPNVIAHIRLNDRTDADGNKVLFVEEIQSDWGQEGKKKGFIDQLSGEAKEFADLQKQFFDGSLPDDKYDRFYELQEQLGGGYETERIGQGIPIAPFVTKTEGWLNLALKRIMVMAAEGGYDKVAFVNGQQSADRYDLSKQVDSIEYIRDDSRGTIGYVVRGATQARDRIIQQGEETPSKLEDIIGKELVKKMIDGPEEGTLSGLDLKVGGEGMKAFYNQIVPLAVKKLLPKVGGGQMGMVEFGKEDWIVRDRNDDVIAEGFSSEENARQYAADYSGATVRNEGGPGEQPGFSVTPEMKRKVETTGLPRFSLRDEGFTSFDDEYPTRQSVTDGFRRGNLVVHARTKDDTDFRYGIAPSLGELVKSTDAYQSMVEQYGDAPELTFFSDNTRDFDSWAKFFAKRNKPVQIVFARKSDSMQKSLGNGKVMTSDGKTMSYEMSPLADYENELMRSEPAFVERGDWYTDKDQDVVAVMDYTPTVKASLRGEKEGIPSIGPKIDGKYLERIENIRRQIGDEYVAGKISFDEYQKRYADTNDEYVNALGVQRRLEEARPAERLEEVFPGFVSIPVGTRISATPRSTSGLPDPSPATVVGSFDIRVGAKAFRLPVVEFADGKRRKLTTEDIKDVYAPRAVKLSLRSGIPLATRQRIDQTTTSRKEEGFVERILDAISPQSFSTFRTQFINRYNQLSVYDKKLAQQMGGVKLLADTSAEAAALFSDLGAGLTASALGVHDRAGGIPVYRNGITIISNQNGTVKGPVAIFAPLAKYGDPFAYQSYQFWSGVKRGSRFMADGREQLFEPADVQKAEALRKQFLQDGVDFEAIQKEWIKFNDGLVDYMVATGVLSSERAAIYKQHSDYLPFYRQMNGEDTVGPKVFQAISGVKPPKKLKGGEAPLDDFLENIVRNVQSGIQAGVKNVAAQRAADVAVKINMANKLNYQSSGPNIFHVYENGKQVSYASQDMLFINAVKSLGLPDIPFIGMLSGPSNLLRNLVTKDPAFMLANLMRDSMAAWVTSGTKMTPLVDTMRNFGAALSGKSPEFQDLLNAGIIGGYEFSQNVEQSGRELDKALRKQAGTKAPGMKGVLEMGAKPVTSLWEALEKGTTASDAATRIEIYKRTLAETGNEAEALYRSLEVMNFNRKGSSAIIRILTAAVPFLNARIQGLDVLYRAASGQMNRADAKEVQRQFFVRGATIAAISAAYWALTHDDEEYKKQEQETRDNYWLLPSLGVKIPIPFEIGVLFKVIPERILAYTMGSDTGEDFLKSMARQLTSTLAFNPIPQAVLPVVESMTNFSFFTMRPIVGQGLDGVQAAYQVGPGTSRLAEFLGNATKGMAKELQISPMKLDQLISGYTGTMGMYLVNLMDAIYDMNTDSPKPSRRFEQMPFIRRFAVDPEARGSVTAYYDLKNSVDAIVRTSNMLERTMNYEELPGYLKDNAMMLASKDYILDLEKTMKEFREMKIMIRSATMAADAKRDAVSSVEKMENQLTANIQYLKSLAKSGS